MSMGICIATLNFIMDPCMSENLTPERKVEITQLPASNTWTPTSEQRLNILKSIREATPSNNSILGVGKYGYGDAIWLYNIAYHTSKVLDEVIKLKVHWWWGYDHLHSFDDIENIIDQNNYMLNFYHEKDRVEVEHITHTKKRRSAILRQSGMLRYGPDPLDIPRANWWKFNPDLYLRKIPHKVVVWRSSTNANKSKFKGKDIFSHEEWDTIYENLSLNRYHVVEVSYRTPIRELFYHINTASSCIGHGGVAYHIANNFQVPCLVVSDRKIVDTHCPNVVRLSDKALINKITLNYSTFGEHMLIDECNDNIINTNNWLNSL